MRYQRKPGTCGPAALLNASKALGVDVGGEATIAKAAEYSPSEGTSEYGIIQAARQFGMTATALESADTTAAWAWLSMHLREGRPVICCAMNWEHWVTTVGLLGDRVLVADPSNSQRNKRENGLHIRSKREFLKQWRHSKQGLYYGIAVGKVV